MKQIKRRTRIAALLLALVFLLSPVISLIQGSGQALAAIFKITLLEKGNLLTSTEFEFFGEAIDSPILYWMKEDGTPLFCIQQHRAMLEGIEGHEWNEEYGESKSLSEQKYELVSIVLQCCGMIKGEHHTLTPGEYIAGQASVWGITSWQYTGPDQLRSELERLQEYIGDWNGCPAEESKAQAAAKIEEILQAIEDYYGNSSSYIPEFASKYQEDAPIWPMEWEEDRCFVTFSLGEKAEEIKEFDYELPSGWSWEWEGDQITFQCEDPKEDVIAITGTAKEGSGLGSAYPIGLVYLVGSYRYSGLQTLAAYVEQNMAWQCYFKLSVPEKPEDPGSWELPEVRHYRHQEDFRALYGVELMKIDGDSEDALSGAEFQVMESFDSGQLEGTVLAPEQFETWSGFKARCPEGITSETGRLRHWDQKEYHYEKTYCGGHPDPEILYEGNSELLREKLEEEAWDAWEREVEACSEICDFHAVDGSGEGMLEAERDLAYQQFIHLLYGYTWKETKPPKGYEALKEGLSEEIYVASQQAGGQTEGRITSAAASQYTLHGIEQTDAAVASRSDAEAGPAIRLELFPQEGSIQADRPLLKEDASEASVPTASREATLPEASRSHASAAGSDSLKDASPSAAEPEIREELQKRRRQGQKLIWLTSMVALRDQGMEEAPEFYQIVVKNYKETPPEETKPEETPPEETKPEETLPEETSPPPEETLPVATPPSSGGGRTSFSPPSTRIVMDPPPLEAGLHNGWIKAGYAPPELINDEGVPRGAGNRLALPKTGDKGLGMLPGIFLAAAAGMFAMLWLRRKKSHGQSRRVKDRHLLGGMLAVMIVSLAGGVDGYGAETEGEEALPEQLVLYLAVEGETDLPSREYVDEEGREYMLDSCQQVEKVEPELREPAREILTYEGIERVEQIPDQVMVSRQKEEDGRRGSGELRQTGISQLASHWQDDFSASVVFYDYGSSQYALQGDFVPGEMELQYLLEHPDLILNEIGCDAEQYEILELAWDGDAYMDQDIPCRKAKARGRKLVWDYQVFYEGEIRYPERSFMEWEAVYQKVPETIIAEPEETKAQEEEVILEEAVPEAPAAPASKQTARARLWQRIRTVAVFTVSLTILLPSLMYLAAFLWKKRRQAWKLSEK